MSCVCILTPVVIAAWPALSATVVAAATSMGYTIVKGAQDLAEAREESDIAAKSVEMEIANSQVVTERLGRDQRIVVARDGITITFARDARGRASLCVAGEGTEEELRAHGQALSQRVVQQYVYDKLKHELQARQYLVVEEELDENRAIRIKVRHWEN
jgi:hypothetical protein